MHLRPIFWMLPSAFSSMVVRPPAMLPLVGCESRQVARLVAVDDLLVRSKTIWNFSRTSSLRQRAATRCSPPVSSVVSPKHQRDAVRVELVERVAHRGVGAAARRGVGFAALGRDPQVLQRALLAAQLARPLHVLLRHLRGAHDGVVVAVALDAEAGDGLAGRGDARRRSSSSSRPRCRSPPRRRRSGSSRCRSACGNAGRGRRRTAGARRDAGSPACP